MIWISLFYTNLPSQVFVPSFLGIFSREIVGTTTVPRYHDYLLLPTPIR